MNTAAPLDQLGNEQLAEALQAAMKEHAGSDWSELNPESIAALAQGRGDELPAQERTDLLRRIASDPDLGILIRELQEDLRDSLARPRFMSTRSIIRTAWAACLIGLLTLTSIRLTRGTDTRSIEVLDAESGGPEFLNDLGNAGTQVPSALFYDPIFVGLFLLVVILGACSFWPQRSSRT
ncbi:MAG: hypothetical protein CMJ39_06425 [Phycisphaerae bacterium]|nr:hypothetical protein [Phycisphaerae bacterium]|tara:strand:- start:178 stop:717 length:540 start_codon:yes stop_codon:yes gene_type:complete